MLPTQGSARVLFDVTDIEYDGRYLWCLTDRGELICQGHLSYLNVSDDEVRGTFEGQLVHGAAPVPVKIEFTDTDGILTVKAHPCRFVCISEDFLIGYVGAKGTTSIVCTPFPGEEWSRTGELMIGRSTTLGLLILTGTYPYPHH